MPTRTLTGPIHQAHRYAARVIEGKEPACRLVQLACKRHLVLWEDKSTERRPREVERAITFVQSLRHSAGLSAGRLFQLAPWQLMITADLFGLYRDGRRLFRRAFLSVPRKNGKTTLAAAVALKLLVADREASPQVLLAGASREQARIALTSAKAMIESTPALSDRLRVYRTSIACPANRGEIITLSGEDSYAYGYHASGAVVDELHAHHDRALWDVVDTSTVGRAQPLVVVISTAGEDVGLIYRQLRLYSEDVLSGTKRDDRWYAFISCADDGDAWDSPSTWAKANPNLGITVQEDELAAIAARAADSPLSQLSFRRLHLNEMLEGMGEWIPLAVWREQERTEPPHYLPGEFSVGLDLASHVDLAAAVCAYQLDGETFWCTFAAWASGRALTDSPAARQLRRAQALGHLSVSAGDAIDFTAIRSWLRQQRQAGAKWLIVDPAGAQHLLAEVVADGWPEDQIVEHPQTARYMDPLVKRVQTLAMERRLLHTPSPLWDLCLGNVRLGRDQQGRVHFHKGRSGGPIDLAVGLAMAAGWQPAPEDTAPLSIELL